MHKYSAKNKALHGIVQGFLCALLDYVRQEFCGGCILSRHYMAVGSKGEHGGAVTEALLNDLVADSVLEQEAGAGVAQAVEAEALWHICLVAIIAYQLGYVVWVVGGAVLAREQ